MKNFVFASPLLGLLLFQASAALAIDFSDDVFWSLPIPSEWPQGAKRSVTCRQFAVELLETRELKDLEKKIAPANRKIASLGSSTSTGANSFAPELDLSDAQGKVHLTAHFEAEHKSLEKRAPATLDDSSWTLSLDEQGDFDDQKSDYAKRRIDYVFKIHPASSSSIVCELDHVNVEFSAPVSETASSETHLTKTLHEQDCESKILDYHEQHEHFLDNEGAELGASLEDLHDDLGLAETCRDSIPYFAAR